MLCVRPRPQFCRNWEEKSKSVPTPAEISWRVFEIHIERGGIHGRDLEDWLRGRMLTSRRVQRHGKRKNKKVRCVVATMSKFVRWAPAMKSLGIGENHVKNHAGN